MFAVVKTGGKQYKVSAGDCICVEKLDGKVGAAVTLDNVMMIGEGESVQVGKPFLSGASVSGKVKRQFKDDKVIIFKKRRRKGYRRKTGHRQPLTEIEITAINNK